MVTANRFGPILLVVLGSILLIYMISVEDEPGAIPLVMITVGIGWLAATKLRKNSDKAKV